MYFHVYLVFLISRYMYFFVYQALFFKNIATPSFPGFVFGNVFIVFIIFTAFLVAEEDQIHLKKFGVWQFQFFYLKSGKELLFSVKSLRNDFCPLFMLSSKNNNTFRIILPTKITRVFGTKEVKKQLSFWQSTCQKSNFLGSTCSDIYSWKSCKHLIISILEED